jgi:hypothetical protein
VDVNKQLCGYDLFIVSFSDYSYRFLINFELFCSNLSVFDIQEFTGRYPFLTFPFTNSNRTKNYVSKNGERFFLIITDRFHPYVIMCIDSLLWRRYAAGWVIQKMGFLVSGGLDVRMGISSRLPAFLGTVCE